MDLSCSEKRFVLMRLEQPILLFHHDAKIFTKLTRKQLRQSLLLIFKNNFLIEYRISAIDETMNIAVSIAGFTLSIYCLLSFQDM